MPTALQALQKEVERLSDGELSKFCIWFNRYLTRYENEKHKDDTKGIHYKDVLQAFKRANLIKGDKPNILEASSAGLDLARFYKETRVKGCHVDDDGDMLAAFWGRSQAGSFAWLTCASSHLHGLRAVRMRFGRSLWTCAFR